MNGAPRIALFIDGANLYATSKQLGFDMDYRRLLREFQGRGNLIRAFYFTTLVESEEYSSIRPLVDWLDYNGYRVITKAAKEFTDATGRRRVKGNMDIELAIEMLELASHLDQIYLFSGDGDFRPLVEAVQRKGVKVSVVSTISTNPPMVSDELRRQCDEFLDLAQLMQKIGRDPSERASRAGGQGAPGTPGQPGAGAALRHPPGRRTRRELIRSGSAARFQKSLLVAIPVALFLGLALVVQLLALAEAELDLRPALVVEIDLERDHGPCPRAGSRPSAG